MRLVRVNYESPDGSGEMDFFFVQHEIAERWAKNLSNIRQYLPYSSVIDDGGVTCWSTRMTDEGFMEPDGKIWQSGGVGC